MTGTRRAERSTRWRWTAWVLALVVLLPVLAACMGDGDDDDPTATAPQVGATATATVTEAESEPTPTEAEETTATATDPEPTATPTAAAEPTATETAEASPTAEPTVPSGPMVPGERPIDLQINWLLTAIAGQEQTNAEIEEHLHPAFTNQVPVSQFAGLIEQLRINGPWEFSGYLGEPIGLDGIALISGPIIEMQFIVGLEVNEPHRFLTLLLVPYNPPALSLAGFEELDGIVESSAPQVSFQVAEITDGTCSPLYGVNPDESLAVASAFKLWVLLELAERVAAGELSWDDPLTLSLDHFSLPSGTLQAEPAGLEFPLRIYASKMMTLSDNTATDHLIARLGRENVEARFAATGHATPERNMPLLLTRELFYLKLAAPQEELDAYVAADSAGRRALLETMTVDFTNADPNRQAIPTAIDSVEWFASAADFCGVMAALHQAGENDPVVREILAASSGVELDPEIWPFVGYKGGNEAGVGSGVWLLERADGRLFTLSAIMNDPDAAVDVSQLPQLTAAVAGLLAELE